MEKNNTRIGKLQRAAKQFAIILFFSFHYYIKISMSAVSRVMIVMKMQFVVIQTEAMNVHARKASPAMAFPVKVNNSIFLDYINCSFSIPYYSVGEI